MSPCETFSAGARSAVYLELAICLELLLLVCLYRHSAFAGESLVAEVAEVEASEAKRSQDVGREEVAE